MGFKKLALAAAVAAAPMSALALEPMADEAMSAVTGQDGISIGLATDISANLIVHDTDGDAVHGLGDSGALVINGFSLTRNVGTESIDLDIDVEGGAAPFLNIGVTLPAGGIQVALGSLDIADSSRTAASSIAAGWGIATTAAQVTNVVNLGTLSLGATTLNIQLGNEPQGDMIALATTITGGINLAGFAVNDAGGTISGGGLLTDLSIVDNGGTGDLSLTTGINMGADGLHIGLDGLGSATGMDVRLANLSVDGGTTQIGDVELVGLNLTGDLIINGK